MRPVIIIPVYNHGLQVGGVIEAALKTHMPVIVVDDGSSDTSPDALQHFQDGVHAIQVFRHEVNQGKGAALLTGFAAAAQQGFDWAVTLDADGQHIPDDAPALIESIQGDERCIVLGKRQGMDKSGNVPWTSRFGRGFSNFWVWVSGGPRVSDSQSGFRLYPLPEVLQLDVQARRYQYEVEVLVKAKRQGIAVREIDVQVVYQARGERVTHFRPWIDFMRNSTTFSRLIWTRIFAWLR